VALSRQKKLDEAIACYKKAIDIDPKHVKAHSNLGAALSLQRKFDQAIDCFEKAIEIDPNHVSAHCNLGHALRDQNKPDEAILPYKKAIDFNPRCPSAHYGLGVALQAKGAIDEAIDAYRKAIELEPKYARAYYGVGVALQCQNKLDEAIATFREAIRQKLAYPAGRSFIVTQLSERAWQLARRANAGPSEISLAIELASEAVELEPASAYHWHRLGGVRYHAGDWKGCIAAQHRSIELDDSPKGGESRQWFFLAMAHGRLGEKDEARKWYNQAVAWMEKHQPKNEEMVHFRAEAAELLGIDKQKD
jgi:superkiller protein 3